MDYPRHCDWGPGRGGAGSCPRVFPVPQEDWKVGWHLPKLTQFRQLPQDGKKGTPSWDAGLALLCLQTPCGHSSDSTHPSLTRC